MTFDNQDARDEVAELARAMQRMAKADADLAQVAHRLAAGDVSVTVTVRGSADVLGSAMLRLKETLVALESETRSLTTAAIDGRLSDRAQLKSFEGAFRDLVGGLNAILDNLLAPSMKRAPRFRAAGGT